MISNLKLQLKVQWYKIFGRRPTRLEATKARARRTREDFFAKYCQGRGLDVGYGGDLLAENCKGYDMEHGDANYLKGIANESFDFVHTSHVIEHMRDLDGALKNWWRVVKKGGYLIIYGPHRDLYEKKKELPSLYNPDHQNFFLPFDNESPHTVGMKPLIERTLTNYEIVYIKVCSEGHTITDPNKHSDGEYSIESVIRKLQ